MGSCGRSLSVTVEHGEGGALTQHPHDPDMRHWQGRTPDNRRSPSWCSLLLSLQPLRSQHLLLPEPPDPLLRTWVWTAVCLEPALRPVPHGWPCQEHETLGNIALEIIGTYKPLLYYKVSAYGEEGRSDRLDQDVSGSAEGLHQTMIWPTKLCSVDIKTLNQEKPKVPKIPTVNLTLPAGLCQYIIPWEQQAQPVPLPSARLTAELLNNRARCWVVLSTHSSYRSQQTWRSGALLFVGMSPSPVCGPDLHHLTLLLTRMKTVGTQHLWKSS